MTNEDFVRVCDKARRIRELCEEIEDVRIEDEDDVRLMLSTVNMILTESKIINTKCIAFLMDPTKRFQRG